MISSHVEKTVLLNQESSPASPKITNPLSVTIPSLEETTKKLEEIKVTPRKEYQKLICKKFVQSIQRPDLSSGQLGETEQQLCTVLDRQDWTAPVFHDPAVYAYCGLKAVEKGRLEVEQFCTLMFYYSVTLHHKANEIQSIPLFLGDQINPQASQLIRETMKADMDNNLSDKEMEKFFENMKKRPVSEQQFFLIPDRQPKEADDDIFHDQRTIMQEISSLAGKINVFCRTDAMRMIPSFGMMQTYLNTKFKDPTQITPIIGMSSFKDIENNGLTKTRDMAIPYPGKNLPDEADLYRADLTYDFIFHDFYHAIVASSIPLNHAQAAVRVAQAVLSLKKDKTLEQVKEFIQEFYARIVDLEFNRVPPASMREY